ncbi:MAG: DUF1353 domain-containing protein [Candidatus Omnitrophica bacterium]|nr:DUF1353 domain-containing protein [Candidatus Omnitrophota bacterium]
MAEFLTELDGRLIDDDKVWMLLSPLVYESDILGLIDVPAGFQTDFSSVPRLPLIYRLYGDRAHREAVLHDYLYRIDSVPQASFTQANMVFLEAMQARGKPVYVKYPMFWGVCLGGRCSYHKKNVSDKLCDCSVS